MLNSNDFDAPRRRNHTSPRTSPHASPAAALVALALAALLATSCATAPKPVETTTARTLADYFPLKKGMAWSYMVKSQGESGLTQDVLLVTRVKRFKDNKAVVESGTTRIDYEVRDDGIFKTKTGKYLIKLPLETGTEWPLDNGSATIARVGHHVTVRGKQYNDCVLVVEKSPSGERVEWNYCRGYGAVEMKAYDAASHGETAAVHAELLAYSPTE